MREWHTLTPAAVAEDLGCSPAGLTLAEAEERLSRYGPNRLEPPAATPRWRIMLRQFKSPLIYVLLAAALIALVLGEISDAGFIAVVLVINAVIGFANEAKADREVRALTRLVRTRARVRRGGRAMDIDGEQVVPGDLLLLESGMRVSADVRLLEVHALRVDESLLTGESLPVDKDAGATLQARAPLAERRNMAFAGSFATSGRASGLVVSTGERTAVGAIASALGEIEQLAPPLIRRMERFARVIGAATVAVAASLVAIGVMHGQPFGELLLGAVALAVSAIPEGLPIALTVALAVAVSRMAKRQVVVRNLPAVEALGSCGVIATDKTGTLTCNELTVERIGATETTYDVTGLGYAPEGQLLHDGKAVILGEHPQLFRLLRAACLDNEASLSRKPEDGEGWEWSGDPTDVALLAAGIKAGCRPVALLENHELIALLPFEPEHRYAASFHRHGERMLVCVKGAPERVLDMCAWELDEGNGNRRPLDRERALRSVESLMREGYRVLAIADEDDADPLEPGTPPAEPAGLVFLGLVAMTDPPRDGVAEALVRCREAGVRVVMVTGDHADTATAIAVRIGLAGEQAQALTGPQIADLDDESLQERVDAYAIVARATPTDKLRIVRAWQQRGALVAVTGDGVNDAPALRQADLGVAMGRAGTDVAREAADLVITDDNFASIVSGIEEGRIAYDNVRKATYLLISTGLGEVILVTLALALGYPLPLTAVQLLWLNLVTNGIQDVALAFEAGEPGVLRRAAKPARERIFDRIMIERTLLAGSVFGGIGLAVWFFRIGRGDSVEDVRNLLVQLFVLFEIFHIGNARSETISLFRLSPLRNPVLLVGTLTALGIHLAALHTPFFQKLLGIAPLAMSEWLMLAALAATIVVVMELHKVRLARRSPQPHPSV